MPRRVFLSLLLSCFSLAGCLSDPAPEAAPRALAGAPPPVLYLDRSAILLSGRDSVASGETSGWATVSTRTTGELPDKMETPEAPRCIELHAAIRNSTPLPVEIDAARILATVREAGGRQRTVAPFPGEAWPDVGASTGFRWLAPQALALDSADMSTEGTRLARPHPRATAVLSVCYDMAPGVVSEAEAAASIVSLAVPVRTGASVDTLRLTR